MVVQKLTLGWATSGRDSRATGWCLWIWPWTLSVVQGELVPHASDSVNFGIKLEAKLSCPPVKLEFTDRSLFVMSLSFTG